jgi:hypothetical protein
MKTDFRKYRVFSKGAFSIFFWKKGTFLHVVEFPVSGNFSGFRKKRCFFENGVFRHGGEKGTFPDFGKMPFLHIWGKRGIVEKGELWKRGLFRKRLFWGVKNRGQKGVFFGGSKKGLF